MEQMKSTSVNLSSMAGTPANAVKLYAPLFRYNGFILRRRREEEEEDIIIIICSK